MEMTTTLCSGHLALGEGQQPTRSLRLWDFPGKSTGMGCHCLIKEVKLLRPPVVYKSILQHALSFFQYVIFAHLCPTVCNPMDWSPPGSPVHGISQARILEQVAISFSRRYSWLRALALAGRFFTTEPPGKPFAL